MNIYSSRVTGLTSDYTTSRIEKEPRSPATAYCYTLYHAPSPDPACNLPQLSLSLSLSLC